MVGESADITGSLERVSGAGAVFSCAGAAMEMKERWVNCTEIRADPASAGFIASILHDGGQSECVARVTDICRRASSRDPCNALPGQQNALPTGGSAIFNVWVREDGARFSRILLTTDPNYNPSGLVQCGPY